MPANIGLLPSAALTGLSEEQQGELQRQATTQFLLGTLLSGDPSMGYKSAMGLPEQAMSAQTQRMALDKNQRDLEELNNFRSQYAPSPTDAAGRAMAGGGGPTRAAAQAQNAILNTPIDIDAAQRAAIGIVGNQYQPRIIESLKAMTPKTLEGGAVVSAGGRLQQYIPQLSPSQGTMIGAEIVNGKPVPFSQEIPGAVATRGRMAGAETFNREMNTLQDTILPSGEKRRVFPNAPVSTGAAGGAGSTSGTAGAGGTGIVTALSTGQTILNEQYKPILESARKGYEVAKGTDRAIDQLQNAFNDPNFDTGSFTNLRTTVGAGLQSFGVTGDRNKNFLVNSLSARRGFNELTGEALKESVGAISNFEIGYYGQRNAQITDPKESTNFNLAVLRETNNRKKQFYNFVADPKNAGGDVLQKWEASPQGSKSLFESPALRKYLPQQTIGDEYGGQYKGKIKHQLPNGKFVIF
jgi:hypothetical protein